MRAMQPNRSLPVRRYVIVPASSLKALALSLGG
jgi:hypothetical protein